MSFADFVLQTLASKRARTSRTANCHHYTKSLRETALFLLQTQETRCSGYCPSLIKKMCRL
jgi:hypothetical protein